MQVLATYAGEEAGMRELDADAALTRNAYGAGEAYFLGCDLGVSDLTRFVSGWLRRSQILPSAAGQQSVAIQPSAASRRRDP